MVLAKVEEWFTSCYKDDSNQQHEDVTEKVKEQKQKEWDEARRVHEELMESGKHFVLGHGPVEEFFRGLEYYLGPPRKLQYEAMVKEHCESADSDVEFFADNYGITTTSKIEWNFVADPSEKNLKKLLLEQWPQETTLKDVKLRRRPKAIDDFEGDLDEINAKLYKLGLPRMTIVEVIALRLWSGPMGVKYNKMIRRYTAGHREGQEWRVELEKKLCLGNKYSTTIHVIQSAISKLGKINPNSKGYSGSNNLLLHERFWKNHPEMNTKGGVEGGLMAVTKDRDVAKYYATLEDAPIGIIFEIDMSTMERGAEIGWLAQYPHENETLLPPLTYLNVEHIRMDPTTDGDNLLMVVEARARISQSIRVEQPLLTDAENELIRRAGREEEQSATVISNSKLLSRFSDEENYLITGSPMESVLGLYDLLGVDDHKIQKGKIQGIKELEREILASGDEEVITNMKYVLYKEASESLFSNGVRDLNNAGKRLIDFVNHPVAKKYQLREEHVAALRIYTTSAFRSINNPLRNNMLKHEKEKKPHPFPVTVSLIDDAIKRLRASTAKTFESKPNDDSQKESIYLWRGMKNTKITEEFLHGKKGGTELGLMSTTRDLKIAVDYSKSAEGNALLLKFRVDNIKQFGADISWLSAFPSEEEILYPPLTYLQPSGKIDYADGMIFSLGILFTYQLPSIHQKQVGWKRPQLTVWLLQLLRYNLIYDYEW